MKYINHYTIHIFEFPLVYLRIVRTDLKSDRHHAGIAGNNPIKTKNAQMQLSDKYQSQLCTSSSVMILLCLLI